MKESVVIIFWIILAIMLQTVVLPNFPTQMVWTDWLFFVVIVVGLKFSLLWASLITVLLGVLLDTISFAPPGTATIPFILVLLLLKAVKANIYMESKIALFFWVTAFSLTKQGGELVVLWSKGRVLYFVPLTIIYAVLQALWNGVLGIILIPLINKSLSYDYAKLWRPKGIKVD